jgi:hypothetical protein
MKTTKKNKSVFQGNKIMESVNRMITEGELENAEAALAAKDLVDRIQDIVEDLGKMSNEELPSLVDAIRNSFGADAATQYQASANAQLNTLLNAAKVAKDELNNSTLVLTGDESAQPGVAAPMGAAGEPGSGEETAETNDADTLDSLDGEDGFDATAPAAGGNEPLGRARREATEESRLRKEFKLTESKNLMESVASIKKRLEAEKTKIAALKKKSKGELDATKTNKKIRASQEKIKSLHTEFTEAQKSAKKLKESLIVEAKKGKKPAFLEKAEVKAEEKEGKKVSAKEKKKVDEASDNKATCPECDGTKRNWPCARCKSTGVVSTKKKVEEAARTTPCENCGKSKSKHHQHGKTLHCDPHSSGTIYVPSGKEKKPAKKKVKEDVDSKYNSREKAHDITDKTANSYTSEKALEKAPRFTDNVYDVDYKPSNSNKGGVYEAAEEKKKCKGCEKKFTGKGTKCPACKKKAKLKESREHTMKLAEMLASKKKSN